MNNYGETLKPATKQTVHRDGTLTFWNVYTQEWRRQSIEEIHSETLATFDVATRARVMRRREVNR